MGSWYEATKNYLTKVGSAYLDFVVPAAMFMVFNMAIAQNAADPERTALLWMNYTTTPEEDRESKFPSEEPGSARARLRSQRSAKASEAAVAAA